MNNEETQKDYTKDVFRPDASLEVSPVLIEQFYNFCNSLVSTDGMGSQMLTEPRFEYLHKETSQPAKKSTSKEKLDKDYVRTFSLDKTLMSQPVQHLTEAGKQALALMREIDQVRIANIEAGRAVLRSDIEKEMKEMQAKAQAAVSPKEEVKPEPEQEQAPQSDGSANMTVVKD